MIYSSFIYELPSFRNGFLKSMDIFGQRSKFRKNENFSKEDANAIASDWKAVGDCLWWAIKEYDKEIKIKD